MKYSRKYNFAASTSLLIALFSTLVMAVFLYFLMATVSFWLLLFFVISFLFSFYILQYRVEKFIFHRIKKMYKDVRILKEKDFPKPAVTTDMDVLTREVENYVNVKKLEIETLNVRENYRKEFMGNVSHELKTPLFTVQSYILTLLDGAMKDKKVRKEYLRRANKGVERLIYIVKELDMIAKLEIGGLVLNKEEFNIISLVQNIFDLLEMRAKKKNISLVFDKEYNEEIIVNADRERIEQVLTNLIVNSLKYGKQDGTTEVSVERILKNKVLVRITDNGEGILKENIPRIFERFYRVDKSGSRKEGGSGLGLSIVKHIVEAHNEKIYIESQFGVGSEFSFTLERGK
ncbi:cell wall metabolism sensor histidine kinase WalK [Aequorivita sp. F47161]|uniref:histidine kinase n=1 Tax=Aequorivita vitellina TaxID=2874475 RepID=A0A9X1QS96_9FLAO|nr:ATP-binding protein [Aequorivita vitellina]MCG2417983.1 cell wall metabolism sensor histidine kinase WalK [Aequorivita vitellina]